MIKQAFYKSIPVMAGYIVLGTGFGILMHNAGYGVLWTAAMSIFIYAGSMQYVGVNLLTGGASVITTALTTVMVNARHLFYSISMVDLYKDAGKYKPYMIFALTDETYSLLCDGKTPEALEAFHSTEGDEECALVAEANGMRLVVRGRRVSRQSVNPADDSRPLPSGVPELILAAPVAAVGLILLSIIEWVRRMARRGMRRRMKL